MCTFSNVHRGPSFSGHKVLRVLCLRQCTWSSLDVGSYLPHRAGLCTYAPPHLTSPHLTLTELLHLPRSTMEGKAATSALQQRSRDAFKTPNITKPAKKAVTISAAGVFQKRKLDTPQLRDSSRSPQKSNAKKTRVKRQEEEVHPLALAFKGVFFSAPSTGT